MSKFKIGDNVWHVDPFLPIRKAIIIKEYEKDGEFNRFQIKYDCGAETYVYDEGYLQLQNRSELVEQGIHLQDAMKGCDEIVINDGVITDLKHCSDITAADILQEAKDCLVNRAVERDKEQERSMKSCVEAFNALTGKSLTEGDGWLLMVCLKAARAKGGRFRLDDYVDGSAYFALYGEAAAKEANND